MKKTRKHLTVIATIAIIGLAFMGCEKGEGDPVLCDCDPKEHYLPCTCDGTDCTCEVIPRGYVTDNVGTQWEINFPIYQSVGVEDDIAVTFTESIITGYGKSLNSVKRNLAGGNAEIWIVSTYPTEHLFPYVEKDDTTGKIIMKVAVDKPVNWIPELFYYVGFLVQDETIVYFYYNGGGSSMGAVIFVDRNVKISYRPDSTNAITKDGYTFVGWYRYFDQNFTEIEWNFEEDIVTDNIIILYAKWE